jgi:hypothetical protein
MPEAVITKKPPSLCAQCTSAREITVTISKGQQDEHGHSTGKLRHGTLTKSTLHLLVTLGKLFIFLHVFRSM